MLVNSFFLAWGLGEGGDEQSLLYFVFHLELFPRVLSLSVLLPRVYKVLCERYSLKYPRAGVSTDVNGKDDFMYLCT